MKHIFKYTIALLGALVLAPASMIAQDGDIVLDKKVIDNGDKTYTLTLETHTTGQTVKTVDVVPTDFVLILDHSGSMSTNRVTGATVLGSQLNKNYSYYTAASGGYYIQWSNTKNAWVRNSSASNWAGNGTTTTINNSSTYYKSRLTVLKEAVGSFIDTVYEMNPEEGKKHRISIVWYGSNTTPSSYYTSKGLVNYSLIELTSETVATDLKSTIQSEMPSYGGNEGTGAGTYCQFGFRQAYNTLNTDAVINDGRNKVVLFFTDGEPGGSAGRFQEYSANAALWHANRIKNSFTNTVDSDHVYPSRVYSIGLMDSGTSGTHTDIDNKSTSSHDYDKYRFMHYVSSNYMIPSPDPYNANDNRQETTIGTTGYFADTFYTFLENVSGAECEDPNCSHSGVARHGGAEEPHGFFKKSDGTDLEEIFSEIAEDNADTNEAVTEETTIVMDALTNMFKLPAGTKPENISLYTCSIYPDAPQVGSYVWETSATTTATSGKTVYKDKANNIVNAAVTEGHEEWWVKWEPWNDNSFKTEIAKDKDGNTIYYSDGTTPKLRYDSDGDKDVDIEDFITINKGKISFYPESDYLEVTGYNFAEHFVGKIFDEDNVFEGWTGQKLIIQFDIEADPANTGGVTLDTNDASSGVYVKDENGKYTAIAEYMSPKVNLPYIKIIKNGLGLRESATFNVLKINADGSICYKSDGETPEYEANVIISKTSDDTPFAIVKLLSAGYYKVTETSWAWAYTSTHDADGMSGFDGYVKQMVLVDGNLTKDNCYLVFTFTNTSKTTAPDHAEALQQNNLKNNYAGGGTEEDDNL